MGHFILHALLARVNHLKRTARLTGVQITATRVAPDGTQLWGAGGVQLTWILGNAALRSPGTSPGAERM